ncbi:MAG TPA: LysR substrate-binding domain-containing protein [Ideonella sp.]|nr:LysR substrate-binding domain-containing protein [Ideonella sp.]
MDQLLAMKVFMRVADGGSFSKAAETLKLPKATVTRLVQRLEESLRMKLLIRTTRHVSLTDVGASYYERAARLLGELQGMEADIAGGHREARGRLRIDVAVVVANMLLIPALPSFQALYPAIEIDLGVSDRPIDMLGEGIDFVVRTGGANQDSTIARRVGELALTTCASPAYLAAHGQPSHPRELDEHHALVRFHSARTRRSYPFDFRRGQERFETFGQSRLSVNDSGAHLGAGLAGLGIIQAPTVAVREHLHAGRLVAVLPEWHCARVPVHLIYSSNLYLSGRHRAFADWVAEVLLDGLLADGALLATQAPVEARDGQRRGPPRPTPQPVSVIDTGDNRLDAMGLPHAAHRRSFARIADASRAGSAKGAGRAAASVEKISRA